MSLQLDSDADVINNVVMSAAAGEEEGLGQGTMVEPIMKEDLPIDLRAKLIIAMINLGLTPSEVHSYMYSTYHSCSQFSVFTYFHVSLVYNVDLIFS